MIQISCDNCKNDLGGGCCRINLEAECREGGGYEAWEPKDPDAFSMTGTKPIIGTLYCEGKKIAAVADIQSFGSESVTYKPKEGDGSTREDIPLMSDFACTMTCTFEMPFISKRRYNELMGWKNGEKPRKRMCRRAAELSYRHVFFITTKRLERLLRRHKERARREWIKTGYDPVWHYLKAYNEGLEGKE